MSTIVDISLTMSNDNPVTLPIATTPGTYNAEVRIGGRPYIYPITVNASDSEIQNVFPGGSLTTLKIYESDGTLLDDTIYNITTNRLQSTTINDGIRRTGSTADGQDTIEDGTLVGASLIQLFVEGAQTEFTKASPDDNYISLTNRLPGGQRYELIILR